MKVLLIFAHPDPKSLCFSIYKKIGEGLFDAGHKVEKVNLYDHKLDFKRTNQKNDHVVNEIQNKLKSSDALIMVYPVWWYSMPAIVKNMIDRTFNPAFSFEQSLKKIKIPLINKSISLKTKKGLLENLKKVLIVNTADTNYVVRKFKYRDSSFSNIKNGVLKVIGAKNIKNTVLKATVIDEKEQEKILLKAYSLGRTF